ncbi:MAG: ORF6N domain-containing protein, partial [Chloroflexi bacterium]|nr:ORF6N domain-containing protein [Chloroflexota bacterium]
MANALEAVSISTIEASIRLLRGQRVMLDSDLATLYGVETRTLVQSVQRN